MKKFVLAFALVSMLFHQSAQAQAIAAPLEDLVINRAIASIISRVAIQRGIAATDARVAATLASIAKVATSLNVASTAVGAGLAIAGAPVWLTIAAGLGIIVGGTALVALSSNGSAGSVAFSKTTSGVSVAIDPQSPAPGPLSAGGGTAFPQTVGFQHVYRAADCFSSQPCFAFPALPTTDIPFTWRDDGGANGAVIVAFYSLFELQQLPAAGPQFQSNQTAPGWNSVFTWSWSSPPAFDPSDSGGTRLIGTITWGDSTTCTADASANEGCVASSVSGQSMSWSSTSGTVSYPASVVVVSSADVPHTYSDLQTAYNGMSAGMKGSPIDPNTLAQLTNQAWQQAASLPDYQGIPYSVSQPVTSSDVQGWTADNPTAVPEIGDLFTPAADIGQSTVVISPTVQPGAGAVDPTNPASGGSVAGNDVNVVNTPSVVVTNKVSVDLGADPGIQTPTLEATPTISMILQPLMNLLPDLRAWAVPPHGVTCPEPSFSLFGQSYTLSAQCDLAESHRTSIFSAFAAMFVIAALFIVLRA